MKTRTLFPVILAVLLVSSVTLSQEKPPQEPSAKETPTDPNSFKNELVTEIVAVEYFPVDELEDLIMNIFRIRNIYSDQRSNRLIMQVTEEQRNNVIKFIEKLDVPGFPVGVFNILGAGDAFAAGFLYGYV